MSVSGMQRGEREEREREERRERERREGGRNDGWEAGEHAFIYAKIFSRGRGSIFTLLAPVLEITLISERMVG